MLTNDQLRDILRKAVNGKPTAWSLRHNLDKSFVVNMISGKKAIPEKVMRILGYEWRIVKIKS